MRRKDREITDPEEVRAVVEKCDTCRIAINGDDGLDLLAKDSRVAFEMDCEHEIFSVEKRGYCTMNYASVMGRARIRFVEGEEEKKIAALTLLTNRYHEGHFEFGRGALKATRVYCLEAETFSAKRHHKTA